MDLALLWKLNHRNVELHADSKGQVGVRRRDGTYRYVKWLGFMSKTDAQASGGIPVKIQAARIGRREGWNIRWQDLPDGSHVQGCLTVNGVYAVFDTRLIVI